MTGSLCIVYSNLGLGGIPKQIVDIVNEMETSHPHTTIYILLKERRSFDVRTTITNRRVVIKDFYAWNSFDNSFLFILWVWVHIFVYHPSAILSFISPYALPVLATKILFFWRKTKIIVNEGHFTSAIINSMKLPCVQRLGIKVLYPLADAIIAVTAVIKNDLIHSYHLPPDRIKIIQNWTVYAKTLLQKTKRSHDLIYIGRFDKTKNLIPLLKILSGVIKQKTHLSCLMVGDGPTMPRCREYIALHGLQKNVLILPPTLDVSVYLKKTKALIFNPDRKSEGFPISILDAMACGTVVITKKFKGVNAVITPTNGYVVSTDREMKRCIFSVLARYSSQQPLIKAAKIFVSRHNSLENIQNYIQCLS